MSELAIAVTVNGTSRDLAAGTTVSALLATLGISTPGVAVALNGGVVPAGAHGSRELRAGDAIEIVRAASGG